MEFTGLVDFKKALSSMQSDLKQIKQNLMEENSHFTYEVNSFAALCQYYETQVEKVILSVENIKDCNKVDVRTYSYSDNEMVWRSYKELLHQILNGTPTSNINPLQKPVNAPNMMTGGNAESFSTTGYSGNQPEGDVAFSMFANNREKNIEEIQHTIAMQLKLQQQNQQHSRQHRYRLQQTTVTPQPAPRTINQRPMNVQNTENYMMHQITAPLTQPPLMIQSGSVSQIRPPNKQPEMVASFYSPNQRLYCNPDMAQGSQVNQMLGVPGMPPAESGCGSAYSLNNQQRMIENSLNSLLLSSGKTESFMEPPHDQMSNPASWPNESTVGEADGLSSQYSNNVPLKLVSHS